MKLEVSDRLQTRVDRPYASRDDHAKALETLRGLQAQGKLKPIDDWDGNLVEGYASILGIQP